MHQHGGPDFVKVPADRVIMSNLTPQTTQNDEDQPEVDESMDGDHESALASAGFGTDEDYGGTHDWE